MREHGLCFVGDMVWAILAGRKVVTRRPIKPQPLTDASCFISHSDPLTLFYWSNSPNGSSAGDHVCPIQVGDCIWCRETWQIGAWDPKNETVTVNYRADNGWESRK